MMTPQGGAGARAQGVIVHAWCEAIDWLEPAADGGGGIPGDPVLAGLARDVAPGYQDDAIAGLLAEFRRWLKARPILDALSRASYPADARVERELPFVRRLPEGIMRGVIDRMVLVGAGGTAAGESPGQVIRAEVFDFKTDRVDFSDEDAVAARVDWYRPQINAYIAAVTERYRLAPEQVSGSLLFFRGGMKREI